MILYQNELRPNWKGTNNRNRILILPKIRINTIVDILRLFVKSKICWYIIQMLKKYPSKTLYRAWSQNTNAFLHRCHRYAA